MRRALKVVKALVTVALLGGVLAAADVAALGALLRDASLGYFALAVAALIAQTCLLSVRFRSIVAALGRPISSWLALELSFIGVLFNQALPSAVGGDAVRAWRLRSGGRPWREAVNAVLLDRVGGVVVLAVLAAVAVTFEPGNAFAALRGPLWLVAAAAVAGVAAVATAQRIDWLPIALQRLLAASALPDDTRSVFATRVGLAAAVLSALSHLLAALAAYWLAAALGLEVAVGTFLTAALCVLLATMIPLSYAGWGIREIGAVWLLGRAGIGTENALAISVLFGAALLIAALPGLAFWFGPPWERGAAPSSPPAHLP